MKQEEQAVAAMLVRINQRLYRLERHLNLPPLPADHLAANAVNLPQLSVVPAAQENGGGAATAAPISLEPPPPSVPSAATPQGMADKPSPPTGLTTELLERFSRTPHGSGGTTTQGAPRRPLMRRPEHAHRGQAEAWSLEKWIGARGFAAAGALIVVIGVVLFIKLAYDRGWLDITPGAKCLVGAGFGVVLLGVGEFLRRRVNAVASAGASAAGIGALYASAYGAYALYHILSAPQAFGVLVAIAAAGIGIGAVSGLAAVAAVSLAGGYLAPLLAGEEHPGSVALPAYLLALLAVALTLSYRIGRRLVHFYNLRALAWWGTMILGGLWTLRDGADAWVGALGFLSIVWCAFHAELLGSAAARDKLTLSAITEAGKDPLDIVRPLNWKSLGSMGIQESRPLLVSFATTAWCTCLGVVLLRRVHPGLVWIVPAAGLAACLAISRALIGHLTVLIDHPRTQMERLGAVLCLSSAGLLIAAIALGLTGWVQFIAWLGLGLAGVASGRWTGLRALERYGLVLLGISAGRALTIDALRTPAVLANWGGYELTEWTAMVGAAGLAWLGAARVLLVRYGPVPRSLAVFAAVVGIVLLNIAAAIGQPQSHIGLVAWCWLALSALAMIANRFEPRAMLDRIGLTNVGPAVIAWALAYPARGWDSFSGAPLAHPGLWLGVGAAALLGVFPLLCGGPGRERETTTALSRFAGGAALLLLLVATSFEVARTSTILVIEPTAKRAVLSVYWAIYSIALLVLGFARRLPPVRYAGLALMGLAACKVVVFDLVMVSQGWRIVSFIGLGLLMLGVAVGYARITRAVDGLTGDDHKAT